MVAAGNDVGVFGELVSETARITLVHLPTSRGLAPICHSAPTLFPIKKEMSAPTAFREGKAIPGKSGVEVRASGF